MLGFIVLLLLVEIAVYVWICQTSHPTDLFTWVHLHPDVSPCPCGAESHALAARHSICHLPNSHWGLRAGPAARVVLLSKLQIISRHEGSAHNCLGLRHSSALGPTWCFLVFFRTLKNFEHRVFPS